MPDEVKKKVTEEELRELIKHHPAFQPFRDKLTEMRYVVARRRLAERKLAENKLPEQK